MGINISLLRRRFMYFVDITQGFSRYQLIIENIYKNNGCNNYCSRYGTSEIKEYTAVKLSDRIFIYVQCLLFLIYYVLSVF